MMDVVKSRWNLFRLNISEVEFSKDCSDSDLYVVRRIGPLERVNLSYCWRLSDAGVAQLEGCRIKVLDLYRNDVEGAFGAPVGEGGRISDKALDSVSRIEGLEELYLWDNDITDRGIARLAGLKQLRVLGISEGRISADALARLKTALPGCTVMH